MRAVAPGRVNLIGEHTDHSGGLALPMAIDLGTTVEGRRRPVAEGIDLRSDADPDPAVLSSRAFEPGGSLDALTPGWARYVAAVAGELAEPHGFSGWVRSTLPVGAGLSSSAALEIAVAFALGFEGSARELAELAQRAEHRASGVPCGLMDQLTIASALDGHALLIDFTTDVITPVPVPDDVAIVIVDSGERRQLATSAYAARRSDCAAAAVRIGSLHDATIADTLAIDDDVIRRRARHVVTENDRVRSFANALVAGDLRGAGVLMDESHVSLRDDFEVSTPVLDALVDHLRSRSGVHGCRLTGAGFGGCVVALTEPGALDLGWTVRPVGAASIERDDR